jgi:ribosomal-protein-alanine N-acetyltransferase
MQLSVRPFDSNGGLIAVQAHAMAAQKLDLACYPPTGLWSKAQFVEEFQNKRTTAIGAWCPEAGSESTEDLVGMAFTSTVLDETALTSIAVHPSARRRGVAEAMLRECIMRAHEAGALRFTLEVRAGNLAARALYAKLGLKCVGRRKRYYSDGEDAMIFDVALARDFKAVTVLCDG